MSTAALHAAAATTRSLTVVLPLPDPLLSINVRRRLHWARAAKHTREQRQAAGYAGKLATPEFPAINPSPFFAGRVRVDIAIAPRPYQKRADDTAVWEAAKPWLDGFEDAALVANDRQFVVGSLTWREERTGQLFITLTETEG